MEFKELLSKIEKLKNAPLKGIEAHKELAPNNRPTFKDNQIPENSKKAGVLVLLYPDKNNNTQILLTKRATYNGTHSNQISFPGGKKNADDSNLQETALRETLEEVGISTVKVIRRLTTIYIPPSNFSVDPYIGILNSFPNFKPNYEVDQIIELPVKHLLDNKNLKKSNQYVKDMGFPCFVYKNHSIWGATAMILNEIKEVLKIL